MLVQCANSGTMCSTLIIGVLSAHHSLSSFKKDLTEKLSQSGDRYDGYHGYKYGFVICTTNHQCQQRVEGFLKELGFHFSIPTYNQKNGTQCVLWHIDMPTLLKNLGYDSFFQPLKVPSIET